MNNEITIKNTYPVAMRPTAEEDYHISSELFADHTLIFVRCRTIFGGCSLIWLPARTIPPQAMVHSQSRLDRKVLSGQI
jgi:hypothetical protein